MPKYLRVFSIRENRWGLGIYTYYPYDNMINLVHIDISNINNDEMSQSPMADHPCCSHFLGDVLSTLSNNQFYSFIGPICNATNLKYLDLSGNRCSSLTPYFFNALPSLETL